MFKLRPAISALLFSLSAISPSFSVLAESDIANTSSVRAESNQSPPVIESDQNESEQNDANNFYQFTGILGAGYQSTLYRGNEIGYIPILALSFDAEYNSWFVESNSRNRVGGVLGRFYLGYHLWEKQNQQLDIVWGHYTPAINKTDDDDEAIPELVNLKTRRDDELLGIRYSHGYQDTYYSLEIAYDILNNSHDSFVAEAYFGKVAAIKNWDLTYGIGATWYSNKVANYNLGVMPSELTDDLSVYSSGSAYAIDLELSAQTPISENWIFEVAVEYSLLSDSIKNSPLTVADDLRSAIVGFSYVF